MSTSKVSLTLDESLLGEARYRVGQRGLSSYVSEALRGKLQYDRLTDLLAELEQEHGAIDPEVMAEVREQWPAPSAKPPGD